MSYRNPVRAEKPAPPAFNTQQRMAEVNLPGLHKFFTRWIAATRRRLRRSRCWKRNCHHETAKRSMPWTVRPSVTSLGVHTLPWWKYPASSVVRKATPAMPKFCDFPALCPTDVCRYMHRRCIRSSRSPGMWGVEFFVWGPLGGGIAEQPNKLFRSSTLPSQPLLVCALIGPGPMKSVQVLSIGLPTMLLQRIECDLCSNGVPGY